MGLFDRLLGRQPSSQNDPRQYSGQGYPAQNSAPYPTNPNPAQTGNAGNPTAGQARQSPGASMSEDERAIARYEYMLKTAAPEEIEAAHAEAFAKLTPEQRQQVLNKLATANPQDAPADASPQNLARSATRAEMRQPGFMAQSFGGYGMGGGFGGMRGMGGRMGGGFGGMGGGLGMGSILLPSIAGAFIGTAVADAMFDGWGDDFDSHDMHEAYEEGLHDGHDDGYGDGNNFADGGGSGDGFDGGFDGGDFGGGDFGGDFGGFDM